MLNYLESKKEKDLLDVDYEKLAEGCHYRMELPKRTEAGR